MTANHAFRARPYERLQDKPMHQKVLFSAVFAKPHILMACSTDAWAPQPAAPPVAMACDSIKSAHSPMAADFIKALVASNGAPNLFLV
jgi:hypothetical protein